MMAFPKYIAWLNGVSVACGTQAEVRAKAIRIFESKLWQDRHIDKQTVLRITTYGSQRFVSSEVLSVERRLA
jgi:hypothetical protein